MRRRLAMCTAGLLLGAASPAAAADGLVTSRVPMPGAVRAVRAVDVDGDGRRDLVVLVAGKPATEGGAPAQEVVVLRTPATPAPGTYFPPEAIGRLPCDGPAAGDRATAAAVAVGRFGPKGAVRLRFFSPASVADVDPLALGAPPAPVAGPSLLARTPGAPLVFWDAVADLDGDGRDETWWPDAAGHVTVGALSIDVVDRGHSTASGLFGRTSRVPSWTPADLDGDGRRELVRLDGTSLVVDRPGPDGAAAVRRVDLPFLAPDPKRPPEEIRAPRLTLADVDGDGTTDLLVTLVQGRADKVGGLRTSLFHLPGPIVDPATGRLATIKGRLDTESVALHPRFVDVDGDGRLDYVADSIRGTTLDLLKRVMGAEPEITFTVVRFDAATGTFAKAPYVTFARAYASAEARNNTFGRSGFFEGDFDGDGVKDLLDLGNLKAFGVWRGRTDEDAFKPVLLARAAPEGGGEVAPDAVIADLDGDGRSDAVLWSGDALHVISSKGPR
ncbi:MAG: VCBS repeat-containing protein [Planctomycetota bacterium]